MRRSLPLLAIVLLAAACQQGSTMTLDGVTLLRYGSLGGGLASVRDGTLRFANGCVVLEESTDDRTLLLWPPDAVLDNSTGSLRVILRGTALGDGTVTSLAGGLVLQAEAQRMVGRTQSGCGTKLYWYVTGVVKSGARLAADSG
jgi:hypothetical protein